MCVASAYKHTNCACLALGSEVLRECHLILLVWSLLRREACILLRSVRLVSVIGPARGPREVFVATLCKFSNNLNGNAAWSMWHPLTSPRRVRFYPLAEPFPLAIQPRSPQSQSPSQAGSAT